MLRSSARRLRHLRSAAAQSTRTPTHAHSFVKRDHASTTAATRSASAAAEAPSASSAPSAPPSASLGQRASDQGRAAQITAKVASPRSRASGFWAAAGGSAIVLALYHFGSRAHISKAELPAAIEDLERAANLIRESAKHSTGNTADSFTSRSNNLLHARAVAQGALLRLEKCFIQGSKVPMLFGSATIPADARATVDRAIVYGAPRALTALLAAEAITDETAAQQSKSSLLNQDDAKTALRLDALRLLVQLDEISATRATSGSTAAASVAHSADRESQIQQIQNRTVASPEAVRALSDLLRTEIRSGRESAPLFLAAARLLIAWARPNLQLSRPSSNVSGSDDRDESDDGSGYGYGSDSSTGDSDSNKGSSEIRAELARVVAMLGDEADVGQPLALLVRVRLQASLEACDEVNGITSTRASTASASGAGTSTAIDVVADSALQTALDFVHPPPIVDTSPSTALVEAVQSLFYAAGFGVLGRFYGSMRWAVAARVRGLKFGAAQRELLAGKHVGRSVFILIAMEAVARLLMAFDEDEVLEVALPMPLSLPWSWSASDDGSSSDNDSGGNSGGRKIIRIAHPARPLLAAVRNAVGPDRADEWGRASVVVPVANGILFSAAGFAFVRRHRYVVAPVATAAVVANEALVRESLRWAVDAAESPLPPAVRNRMRKFVPP